MTGRRGVLTAGTWCVDNNKTLARWPQEDTMSTYLEIDRQGGGSGCNMAIDLKKLDPAFPVETMALLGDDDDGRFLLGQCAQYGIDHQNIVLTKAGSTPFTDCFNSIESGKRTHLFYPGVADLLSPDHFDFSRTRARLLHLGLPGAHKLMDQPWQSDPTGWTTVLRKAKVAGLLTNLEMVTTTRDKVQHFGRSCLPYLDLLIVNDYEIGAVAGIETRDGVVTKVDKVIAALEAVMALGPLAVAVAHFPEGAIALMRDARPVAIGSVAMPSNEIVGVNGAGDAFAAGFLYQWLHERPPEEALRFGHAVAAASMRDAATTTGVGPVKDIEALAARWGYRTAPV
jgi:sugar/nucleoside kinase (ribokinase family)